MLFLYYVHFILVFCKLIHIPYIFSYFILFFIVFQYIYVICLYSKKCVDENTHVFNIIYIILYYIHKNRVYVASLKKSSRKQVEILKES